MLEFRFKKKTKYFSSEDIGNLIFGQLHILHQEFFNNYAPGKLPRILIRNTPHYRSLLNENNLVDKSIYNNYLINSWNYYYPKNNTQKKRDKRINEYQELYKDVKLYGVQKPIEVVKTLDNKYVIISGNHRASIAYKLGQSLPYQVFDLNFFLNRIVKNSEEFYGTKNLGMPYQDIVWDNKVLVRGRRTDILERFKKVDIINDIRGKDVADLGSNLSINTMLCYIYGANQVTGMEFSKEICTAALRLSTIFDVPLKMLAVDLGKILQTREKYDTVFCNSVDKHVKNNKILADNILKITKKILYLEGHAHTTKEDYKWLLKHFSNVQFLGYNADGIHNNQSTRPFFRCEK